jgi:hypothetical protein
METATAIIHLGMVDRVFVRPVEVARDAVCIREGVDLLEPLLEAAEPPLVVRVVEVALHVDEVALRRRRAIRRAVDDRVPVARHVRQVRTHAIHKVQGEGEVV